MDIKKLLLYFRQNYIPSGKLLPDIDCSCDALSAYVQLLDPESTPVRRVKNYISQTIHTKLDVFAPVYQGILTTSPADSVTRIPIGMLENDEVHALSVRGGGLTDYYLESISDKNISLMSYTDIGYWDCVPSQVGNVIIAEIPTNLISFNKTIESAIKDYVGVDQLVITIER